MTQTLSLTPTETLDLLESRAEALMAEPGRRILALAGGPGTGKSTLAALLVARLAGNDPRRAALVPMDGFHMRHAKLEALGTVAEKGAAHTFEAEAFVSFVRTLRDARTTVIVPGYSRAIEDVVENVGSLSQEIKLLVIEGNYLLLPEEPWAGLKALFDLSVYLEVPREKVRARLLKRHAEHGLFTEARNRAHVETVDLANYDKVARSRSRADLAVDLVTEA